ncbi:MAG: putative toxin-antitoxin system toxin component, PIN family, partial [Pseudomonadota bacterium]
MVASALLWGGEPGRLLRLARERRIAAFTSTALLAELADILGRRKFEYKIAASLMSVDQLVDRYADLASVVRPVAVVGIAPDPDDDVVIGTALAARADLVVTGDRSLLAVGAHRDVRILGVSEALAA